MRSVLGRARALGIGAALAIGVVGAIPSLPAAAAASNWTVRAGNESGFTGVNKFYPDDITVHPGDTVTFAFNGFHTVTFNPPANLSLFDFAGFTGVPVGSSTLDTPTTFVNGAAPPGPPGPAPAFVLTIAPTLPAGTYAYRCRIHQFMHGVIHVTNGPLPSTDAQNQALAHAQMDADNERAAALNARFTQQTAHNDSRALVGAGDRTTEFVTYYPTNVTITAGEQLTFVDRDLHEPHTVSFGPIPGNPFNPLAAAFPTGPGDPNAYDGTSALSSGWLLHESEYDYWRLGLTPVAAIVPTTQFSVRFTTPGTYKFYCAIHGAYINGQVFGMSGSITVLRQKSG